MSPTFNLFRQMLFKSDINLEKVECFVPKCTRQKMVIMT